VAKKLTLFTVGYEKRSIGDFTILLQRAGVTLVADVRDYPQSRFRPEFGKKQLSESLPQASISYLHVPAAGNPKHIRDSAEDLDDSLAQYKKYLTKTHSGLDDLETIIKANSAVALLCYERDVLDCHRQHLVAALQKRMSLTVKHL
jgi:uncharacterized protein (DUF488 family)